MGLVHIYMWQTYPESAHKPGTNKSSAIEHFDCDGAVKMKDGYILVTIISADML